MGDANGTGTISEFDTGDGVHMVVRDTEGASGTFTGWGTVGLTGTLYNNGRVEAKGFGTDRDLDLSSFQAVVNHSSPPEIPLENPTNGINGWYAVDHGRLKLPVIPVSADVTTYNWGESSYGTGTNEDAEIDLVNSVQLGFTGLTTTGYLSIDLLAPNHGQVPANMPAGCTANAVWNVNPEHPLSFTELDMTFRYDNAVATATKTPVVLRYNGTNWLADVEYSRDLNKKWVTLKKMTALSSFYAMTQVFPGDANCDGMVDVGDLGILAGNYGTNSGATWAIADFNGDGMVDVGDLGILAGNYGAGVSQSASSSGGESLQAAEGGEEVLAVMETLGLTAVMEAGGNEEVMTMTETTPVAVVVDPGVDVGDGLTSYTVRLVANSAANTVIAFDGAITGSMHQVWFMNGIATPAADYLSFLPVTDAAQDSHFLFAASRLTRMEAPVEDNDLSGGEGHGEGTSLSGAFALGSSLRTQNLSLTQIVLAAGQQVTLNATVANAAGEKFILTTTISQP